MKCWLGMRADSEIVMPPVEEQCEQSGENWCSLREAAKPVEVAGVHKSKVLASSVGSFCSAYDFRLFKPGCLLLCIDISTL